MATTNTSCPLDLSPTTLAAWRDGALPTDASRRIAGHVSTCLACQREIARSESLDEALRRQPAPASDGRLWRDVRAGMANSRSRPHRPQTVRRMVGAGSALAAVLLLAIGFAQLFRLHSAVTDVHPAATGTISATATIQGTPPPLPTAIPALPAIAGARPTWQTGNFPAAGITFGDQSTDILAFAVAPSDGQTAYACYSTTDSAGSRIRIYRTANRAQTWTLLTTFSAPHVQTSDCTPQVDALDAGRALVSVTGQDVQTLQTTRWHELTEDGGATWTKLSYDDQPYGIATVKGQTYALRMQAVGTQPNGQPKYEERLVASSDHLRTWRPIDRQLLAMGQSVTQFWARPDGALLVTTALDSASFAAPLTPTATQDQPSHNGAPLWQSADGGGAWNVLLPPILSGDLSMGAITVGQPTGQQPWRICARETPPDGRTFVGIICTFDGGQTWSVRPYLCASAPCPAVTPIGFAGDGDTLAADNSLLIMAPDKNVRLGLYRLPAHASQWEYLGPANGSNTFFYAPASHGGVLWLFAGGIAVHANLSGVIGGHLGSVPTTALAAASYP